MIISLREVSRGGLVKTDAFEALCQNVLGQALAPPSILYVTVCRLLPLSVPPSPHLKNGDDNSTHPS